MKLLLLSLVGFLLSNPLFSQVGIGTNSPHASSIVDVESENKGFLLPRLASHADVVAPAIGLMIYDLSDKCINVFIGNNTWKNLCEGSGGSGIITTPPSHTEGNLQVSMKLCYDIAFSNDLEDGCGSLTTRDLIKSDFTQTSSNTQTLTITTDVDISELQVVAVDGTGNVIQNVNQPASTDLLAGNTTTTTIEFKSSLNTDAQGLDFSTSLKSEVYVTYKDNNGNDRQRKVNLRVQDCNCSSQTQDAGETAVLLDAEGNVYTYGINTHSAAADATAGHAANNVKPLISKITMPTIGGSEAKIVQVNSGGFFTLGLTDDGKVVGWGKSHNGQLGSVTGLIGEQMAVHINASRGFPDTETAIGVFAGTSNTFILTESNKLYGAGYNPYGAIGNGSTSQQNTYVQASIAALSSQNSGVVPVISRFFVGDDQNFFVDEAGALWGVGRNNYGQLGLGNTTDATTYKKITNVPSGEIINISSNFGTTLLHMSDGNLYMTGRTVSQITSTLTATDLNITTFEPVKMDGDISSETGNIVLATFANRTAGLRIMVYYDNGKFYTKGAQLGAGNLGVPGGYVGTFVEADLSNLNGSRITKIKTYDKRTVLITENGRIFSAGKNGHSFLLNFPVDLTEDNAQFIGPEQTLAKTTIFVN